ncbi:MAG: LptF/LptG family permease [Candidatus Lightella neohaematopini]|nr:LptF/LptG family permease [Candidatus Lightella neohaematopini]
MIIIKYIFNKICKIQTIVILTLVLVFFCHKTVQIIKLISIGYITKILAINLIILKIPEIIQMVIPVSVIISVFITVKHIYNNNELLAIYSCGYNKNIIYLALLIMSIFIMFLTTINSMWIVPISNKYYCQLLFDNKQNNINQLILNNFPKNINNNIIFNNILNNIYSVKIKKNKYYLISTGSIDSINANNKYKLVILCNGKNIYYNLLNRSVIITKFKKYYLFFYIKNKKYINLPANQLNLNQLINTINVNKNELHWRYNLILSIPLFYLLSVIILISDIKRIFGISLIITLYILFFIIQHLLRISTISYSYLLMWLLYVFYLNIIILMKYLTNKLL